MKPRRQHIPGKILFALILSLFFAGILPAFSQTEKPMVKIGVVARRGIDQSNHNWQPLAAYLNNNVADYAFTVIPVKFEDAESLVRQGRFDFMICNPTLYVQMETEYGASRIATLRNLNPGMYSTLCGSVFICKTGRQDIRSLRDLRRKKILAVDPLAFTGWIIGEGELRAQGIISEKNFESVAFAGTHDGVIYGVLEGKADAGIIGTGILEQMEAEGKINRNEIRVVNQRKDVPFPCSSALYPDWAFARMKNTPSDLTTKVAIALLSMPADSNAARSAGHAGWAVAQNYQPVHDLLMRLRLPPYEMENKATVYSLMQQRQGLVRTVIILVIGMLVAAVALGMLQLMLVGARRQMEKMQEHQRSLYDSFPAMIWRSGIQRRCDYFNKAWVQFTGHTLENDKGDCWLESIHPDEREQCAKTYTNAFALRNPFQLECHLRRSDGEYSWVVVYGRPYHDINGDFAGYLGLCFDVSEHKQISETLGNNVVWLQGIIDAIPNPVFFKDEKGVYSGCNSAFLEYLGLSRNEVIGHTVYEVSSPELADVHARADRELLARGGRQQYEMKVKYADGSYHDIIHNKAAFKKPDGTVGGIVGVMIDIAGLKSTNDRH